jgi:hypothetical protein
MHPLCAGARPQSTGRYRQVAPVHLIRGLQRTGARLLGMIIHLELDGAEQPSQGAPPRPHWPIGDGTAPSPTAAGGAGAAARAFS